MLLLQSFYKELQRISSSSYYRPQRSWGNDYIFTGVCDSVNKGGGCVSASVHAGIPNHPEQKPPPVQTPPQSRHHPLLEQVDHPRWADTSLEQMTPREQLHPPRSRHPLGADTPLPRADTPTPGAEHARRYGQRAGGTLLECNLVEIDANKRNTLDPACNEFSYNRVDCFTTYFHLLKERAGVNK